MSKQHTYRSALAELQRASAMRRMGTDNPKSLQHLDNICSDWATRVAYGLATLEEAKRAARGC